MSTASNMITLKSSDGEVFEVEGTVLMISQTIKNMIEDGCADNVIPLPNVTGKTLSKVIEYCKNHIGEDDKPGNKPDHVKAFDDEFVQMEKQLLLDLILAANYLNIRSLLDITCQNIADMIKVFSSPEEAREKLGIENDFTPEEEAEIRRENQWAFE